MKDNEESVCRGDEKLGTNCGHCKRCRPATFTEEHKFRFWTEFMSRNSEIILKSDETKAMAVFSFLVGAGMSIDEASNTRNLEILNPDNMIMGLRSLDKGGIQKLYLTHQLCEGEDEFFFCLTGEYDGKPIQCDFEVMSKNELMGFRAMIDTLLNNSHSDA